MFAKKKERKKKVSSQLRTPSTLSNWNSVSTSSELFLSSFQDTSGPRFNYFTDSSGLVNPFSSNSSSAGHQIDLSSPRQDSTRSISKRQPLDSSSFIPLDIRFRFILCPAPFISYRPATFPFPYHDFTASRKSSWHADAARSTLVPLSSSHPLPNPHWSKNFFTSSLNRLVP